MLRCESEIQPQHITNTQAAVGYDLPLPLPQLTFTQNRRQCRGTENRRIIYMETYSR